MSVSRLQITSLEEEDRLLYAVITDEGETLHPETGEKFFRVRGSISQNIEPRAETGGALQKRSRVLREQAVAEINARNSKFFDEEIEKLERWSDDLKYGLEVELKELDARIRALKKDAGLALDLQGKLEMQRQLKDAEAERSRKRRRLYEAQDRIDEQKEDLISSVEARLRQKIETEDVFTIRWKLI
ncbi:MAG TPA: hypothetical protein VGB68_10910 [Pyrinomonadaceae bacterium]|jgi:adenine-specific DNA-methyltransferase